MTGTRRYSRAQVDAMRTPWGGDHIKAPWWADHRSEAWWAEDPMYNKHLRHRMAGALFDAMEQEHQSWGATSQAATRGTIAAEEP